MYTVESTLETLEKYDIDQSVLAEWEHQLNLSIPIDENGVKRYSPHHINLFKNVRKHLALGRTLEQIRDMITLPPSEQARPAMAQSAATQQPASRGYASSPAQKVDTPIATTTPLRQGASAERTGATSATQTEAYASRNGGSSSATGHVSHAQPSQQAATLKPSIATGAIATQQNNALLTLVERLMAEKDQLNKKLMETEKLNSHLYNANALFHRKVKEHAAEAQQLKDQLNTLQTQQQEEGDAIRHLDEKSRLHKQLLEMEKSLLMANQQIVSKEQVIQQLQQRVATQEQRLSEAHQAVSSDLFKGTWIERAQLSEIVYDTFGINFESERQRTLNIPDAPQRIYGNAAVLVTQYAYEANPMWKRHETLMVSYKTDNELTGELTTEFMLDGVPVGKAIYTVQCTRQAA